ncbi:hypothetical protein MKW92_024619 [Papaver armeniacum]|nr:hypothetical protein MKW92_024619 [Papaver armeniacum]
MNGNGGISSMENEYIYRHHKHDGMRDNQCSSALVKHIKAPLHLRLPATTSTERLELLDDEEHILSIRIVGVLYNLLQNFGIFSKFSLYASETQASNCFFLSRFLGVC